MAKNSHRCSGLHDQISELTDFIRQNSPLVVLTGAGISTDSGIPAYRDSLGNWKRAAPVQHRDFMNDENTRRRYWARSLIGWPLMQQAVPNIAHFRIADLQQQGMVPVIVTQNVDRLHQKAGSRAVIDLHGRADMLLCTACGHRLPREEMHNLCSILNPSFADLRAAIAPDGDADLETEFDTFKVPGCPSCEGILKTDVVFFGDNVPRGIVDEVFDHLDKSSGMLVIGSSLMVYSGYRFARHMYQHNKPLAIVTQGVTRADDLASLKIDASIGAVLGPVRLTAKSG